MKVFHLDQVPKEDFVRPIFAGGDVQRQTLVSPNMGKNFNCAVVHFSKGAGTVPHTHTSDQILIITSGEGVVGDDEEEIIARPGDVIFSPGGVKHWHGATKDSEFSHIMILSADNKTEF